VCTNIFFSKSIIKILTTMPTRLLVNVQRITIHRAYFACHQDAALPPRLVSPFEELTPEFLYKLVEHTFENGLTLGPAQAAFPELSADLWEFVTKNAFAAISADVYARAFAYDITDTSNKYLQAVALSLKSKPFAEEWPEPLVLEIIRHMSDFGVSSVNGRPNWAVFAALAGVTDKSAELIDDFMKGLNALIIACSTGSQSLILPEELTHVKRATKVVRGKEHHIEMSIPASLALEAKTGMDLMGQVRNLIALDICEVRPQAFLPPSWTSECDIALLQGVCQYGYKSRSKLPSIPFKQPQRDSPDPMMCRPLDEFSDFLTDANAARRIQFLIFSYTPVKINLSFFDRASRIVFRKGAAPSGIKNLHQKYEAHSEPARKKILKANSDL
jgi:hypothetical protein